MLAKIQKELYIYNIFQLNAVLASPDFYKPIF